MAVLIFFMCLCIRKNYNYIWMVLDDKYIIANNWHIHRLSHISCLRSLSSFILLHVLWILRCGLVVLIRLCIIKLIFDIWSSRGKNCKYALNAVNWLCIYCYYVSPQKILFFWYILNKIALFGYFGVNIPTEVLCQCCQSSCVNNMDVNST